MHRFEFKDIQTNSYYTFSGTEDQFTLMSVTGLIAHTLVSDVDRVSILKSLNITASQLESSVVLAFLANTLVIGVAMQKNEGKFEAIQLDKHNSEKISMENFEEMLELFTFKNKGLEVSVKNLFGIQSDDSIPSSDYLTELFNL